jgi:hypothetical protein
MIRRVKFTGYKSLGGLEVELRPLTVIFGPGRNARELTHPTF